MRNHLILATVALGTSLLASTASADPMPPPPPSDDAAPAAKADGIPLHVDSATVADLEHRATPSSPWENVCVTPCDVQAKPGEQYRVLGMDISPSEPFVIDGSKGKVTLKVRPGSIRKSRTGLWLLGGAGALGIASIITLIAGGAFDGFGDGGVVSQGRTDALFAGSFMLIGALGLGVWGGATWYNNKTSTVDGPVLIPGSKGAEPMPAPKAAFMFPVLRLQF